MSIEGLLGGPAISGRATKDQGGAKKNIRRKRRWTEFKDTCFNVLFFVLMLIPVVHYAVKIQKMKSAMGQEILVTQKGCQALQLSGLDLDCHADVIRVGSIHASKPWFFQSDYNIKFIDKDNSDLIRKVSVDKSYVIGISKPIS